jgi:hypothetical protein
VGLTDQESGRAPAMIAEMAMIMTKISQKDETIVAIQPKPYRGSRVVQRLSLAGVANGQRTEDDPQKEETNDAKDQRLVPVLLALTVLRGVVLLTGGYCW